jgi:hypothetical protein
MKRSQASRKIIGSAVSAADAVLVEMATEEKIIELTGFIMSNQNSILNR